jgi:hypothetical protein
MAKRLNKRRQPGGVGTQKPAPLTLVFHDIHNGYEPIFEKQVELGYPIPNDGDLFHAPDHGLMMRVRGRQFVDAPGSGVLISLFVESVTEGEPGVDLTHLRGFRAWMKTRA